MERVNYIFKINDQEQANEYINCTYHDNTITFIYFN